MNFEQESENSPWKNIHPTFKIISEFHGGKKSTHKNRKNKLFNQLRLVTIQEIAYLEVTTQKLDITFLCDIKNYTKLRQHIWFAHKNGNTFYIETNIKKDNKCKNLKFHRLIHPDFKMIDHINRIGYDNREINLRDGSNGINNLNKGKIVYSDANRNKTTVLTIS